MANARACRTNQFFAFFVAVVCCASISKLLPAAQPVVWETGTQVKTSHHDERPQAENSTAAFASSEYFFESDLSGTHSTYFASDHEDQERSGENRQHADARADDYKNDDEQHPMGSRRDRRTDRQRSQFDESVVRQGQQFFQSSCTQCHDADRALSKRKSLAGWSATVRRMAAKEAANIPASQWAAIATYLASLNPTNQSAGNSDRDSRRKMARSSVPLPMRLLFRLTEPFPRYGGVRIGQSRIRGFFLMCGSAWNGSHTIALSQVE